MHPSVIKLNRLYLLDDGSVVKCISKRGYGFVRCITYEGTVQDFPFSAVIKRATKEELTPYKASRTRRRRNPWTVGHTVRSRVLDYAMLSETLRVDNDSGGIPDTVYLVSSYTDIFDVWEAELKQCLDIEGLLQEKFHEQLRTL